MVYSENDRTDLLLSLLVEDCGNDEVEEFKRMDASDIKFSKRYYKKRNRIINGAMWKPIWKSIKPILTRVAIVCLVVLSLAFTAVMSVSAIRKAVWQVIVDWYEDHFEITHDDGNDKEQIEAVTKIEQINKPATLPNGMEEEIVWNTPIVYTSDYYIGDEYIATFKQTIINETGSSNIDNEGSTVYHISVNNQELLVVENNVGEKNIYWNDEYYSYVLHSKDLDILLDLIKRI